MPSFYRQPTSRAEATCWAMNATMRPANMVTLVTEADATSLQRLRAAVRDRTGAAPSCTALVIKAAALTLKLHPHANRAILGPPLLRRLYEFDNIDIAVAVEKALPMLPGQAFAAPIRDAVGKSPMQITAELRHLARCDESDDERYRTWMDVLRHVPRPLSLWLINSPNWSAPLWVKYRGCAAWVNAPSRAGVDLVMTTWPWPLTFSFGVIRKRPFVVDDALQARATVPLVMVFDRRIMGGGPAGRLFVDFKRFIEDAERHLASPAEARPEAAVAREPARAASVLSGMPASP